MTTGSVTDRKKPGRRPTVATEKNVEMVSHILTNSPISSIRKASLESYLKRSTTVQKIVGIYLSFRSWKPHQRCIVQEHFLNDCDRLMEFAESFYSGTVYGQIVEVWVFILKTL